MKDSLLNEAIWCVALAIAILGTCYVLTRCVPEDVLKLDTTIN